MHLKTKHQCTNSSVNNGNKLKCSLCKFETHKWYYLKQHLYQAHNPEEASWNIKKLKKPKQDRTRPGSSANKQETKLRSVIVENKASKNKTGKRTFHSHRGRGEVSSDSSDDHNIDILEDPDTVTLLASPGVSKLEEEPSQKNGRFHRHLCRIQ